MTTSIAAGEIVMSTTSASVTVGGHTILDDVSVDVRAGEFLALVGPNGAGKSTLLGVLAGDITPTTGDAHLRGSDLRSWRSSRQARHRAVLLQEQRLSFPFRVAEVVAMGRAPWRGHEAEDADERIVADAMATADVTALAERTFPTLSGGEKARTSYARVLAQSVPILLLDEPTAALDIHHQEAVLANARAAADEGAAIVAVLHDLSLAAAYADRVALLCDGEIRAHGKPRDVLVSDLVSDVYQHEVDIFDHPNRDELVIVPRRAKSITTANQD